MFQESSRWGCEISFRYLKHAAGLLYFHAKKPEFLQQEIYSTLTMYNFGVFLANAAAAEYEKKKKKPNNKYRYSIDFSTAIKKSRDYFLCRFVHAVKEKYRQFERPLRGIGAIHFNYR